MHGMGGAKSSGTKPEPKQQARAGLLARLPAHGGPRASAVPARTGTSGRPIGEQEPAPDPRRWWALLVIDLCLLAITMDNTILNVALPSIARDLSATGSQLQWMVDAYIVVFAGLLLTSGTIGDRLGRRRMLLGGLTVFGAASAMTLLVGAPDQLIAIRAMMGLGAALLMPATLSLITNLFPASERPRAIATWAAVSGLGMVLGPIIGGALLDSFAWNSVFLVNVPIAIVGIAGTFLLMPESRDPKPGRVDPIGAILSMVALATLVYGIIEAPAPGWTAPETILRIGAGLVALAAFVLWELHNREPMFDIGLFLRPAFGATSFAETVAHFAIVGVMFALTQYLQFVWGQKPLAAGLSMLPIAFGVIGGTVIVSRLMGRIASRYLIVAGMLGIAGGMLLISRLTVDSPYVLFAASLFVLSGGMGIAMAPATDSIMGAVDKARAGVGSATNDTTRELGSALGVAVVGSLISSGYRDALAPKLAAIPGAAQLPSNVTSAINDSLGSAMVAAGQLPGATGAAVVSAAKEAFVSGMSTAAIIGAAVIMGGVALLLHWLPDAGDARTAEPAGTELAVEAA